MFFFECTYSIYMRMQLYTRFKWILKYPIFKCRDLNTFLLIFLVTIIYTSNFFPPEVYVINCVHMKQRTIVFFSCLTRNPISPPKNLYAKAYGFWPHWNATMWFCGVYIVAKSTYIHTRIEKHTFCQAMQQGSPKSAYSTRKSHCCALFFDNSSQKKTNRTYTSSLHWPCCCYL